MPEPAASPAIRVLLVDDHPVYRDGLAVLLRSIDGLDVVGTAADGLEAVAAADADSPDVIVMDVQMPRMDGIEATRRITAKHPAVGIIVLTMSEADETVFDAMRAGARGYLLKGSGQDDISRAIRAVAGGDAIFGPRIAARVAEFFARPPVAADPVAFPQLTGREREILELVASGRSNGDIAEHLFLSPKTVRNNVSNIFTKLQVSGRAEAVIAARDAGLGRRADEPGSSSTRDR
ncbi:response regulator [Agromyces sp. NPDC058136]|uniref:response regulator n=1 Tax=Agromyces sp. NPDC058136 TaxID=3346354 RepID=UPI0036D7866F